MLKALISFFLISISVAGQKQTAKWLFGEKLGIDFLTTPPSLLSGFDMVVYEGTSSICDKNGNLLLYTDGDTIWNGFYQPVANGIGIYSGKDCFHHLIVQQPDHSDIFYVFTTDEPYLTPNNGLNYSIVNTSLAGGSGSVISKNNPLIVPTDENVAAVSHCNGRDIWILGRSAVEDTTFYSFLLTPAGLNTVGVKSVVPPISYWPLRVKFSTTGRHLVTGDLYAFGFALYDFDNATGVVSNKRNLATGTSTVMMSGMEFSPDGSKLYGVADGALYQWNLCAGSDSLLLASRDSVKIATHQSMLQLAIDGRIYCSPNDTSKWLDIIADPNAPLAVANFSPQSLYVGKYRAHSIPNFMSSYFREMPSYTHSVVCGNVSFNPPDLCPAQSRSVTARQWFFGDTASGSADTSFTDNPVHVYSAPGDYTVTLLLHYGCGADTIRQVVSVTAVPLLTVTGDNKICKGEATTFSVSGAVSYSWNGTAGNSSAVFSPTASSVYTVSGTGSNGCAGSRVFSVAVDPCIGLDESGAGIAVSVFPNPSGGIFTINAPQGSELSVRDVSGRLLLRQAQAQDSDVIDISGYADGMYLLEVRSAQGSGVMRLHKNGSR